MPACVVAQPGIDAVGELAVYALDRIGVIDVDLAVERRRLQRWRDGHGLLGPEHGWLVTKKAGELADKRIEDQRPDRRNNLGYGRWSRCRGGECKADPKKVPPGFEHLDRQRVFDRG